MAIFSRRIFHFCNSLGSEELELARLQLVQVKKEPEKTLGSTMMVQSDVTTLEGPQSLCANEGDQAPNG